MGVLWGASLSFILPQPFRSLFESEAPQSTERQSDLSDQIIPVAIIAFTASLFNSFVAMLFTPQAATVNCTYTGSNWHWAMRGCMVRLAGENITRLAMESNNHLSTSQRSTEGCCPPLSPPRCQCLGTPL